MVRMNFNPYPHNEKLSSSRMITSIYIKFIWLSQSLFLAKNHPPTNIPLPPPDENPKEILVPIYVIAVYSCVVPEQVAYSQQLEKKRVSKRLHSTLWNACPHNLLFHSWVALHHHQALV